MPDRRTPPNKPSRQARPTARIAHCPTTAPCAGRLNCYVVFGLGQRRMRTAISLDNNSPEFGETFWVMVDRDFEASQLLSMQVYQHSLHPSDRP